MIYRWRCSINTLLVVGIITSLLITTSFWLRCGEERDLQLDSIYNTDVILTEKDEDEFTYDMETPPVALALAPDVVPLPYHQIECSINDEYSIPCRREKEEVYMPFSFISRYFEVYGKMESDGAEQHFDWQHSYSKVYYPGEKYTPDGVFMSFAHYNVEVRDRVKCISGLEGVPVSTQWGPQGYFYPIQIAQYGLSHYSKFLTDSPPVTVTLENAEDDNILNWMLDGSGTAKHVFDSDRHNRVIEFHATESLSAAAAEVSLQISNDAVSNFFLSLDIKFTKNGSIGVVLAIDGKSPRTFTVFYVCSDIMISIKGNDIVYGIGTRNKWSSITRDIQTDFLKGMMHKYSKNKKKVSRLTLNRIVRIDFYGSGYVDNVTLASSHHLAQFYYAADWLVRHQDKQGGWPITVMRKLADGRLELPPGWYSAMAQGQAISVLVRAYLRTKRKAYLEAALRSTTIFNIPSSLGGVLAKFVDRFPWYEEYPTTPSCYVLNGFIYSLIGLYDLKTVAPPKEAAEAKRLFDEGVVSLKAMLPLFDTGSGTVYDLRHFTLSGMAPNLARWDYHATHINQLLLMSKIDEDPLFQGIVRRWISYMKGKRAPHN